MKKIENTTNANNSSTAPDSEEKELVQLHEKILEKLTAIGEIKNAEMMTFEVREDLEKTFLLLFDNEPYYGYFMGSFNRRYTLNPAECPTLGVSVQGGGISLIVNVIFWKSLKLLGKLLILKHEALHIINEHIVRSHLKGIDGFDHQLANVSMDMAINQFIFKGDSKNMDNIVKWPEIASIIHMQFPEDENLPLNMPWEYYFDELRKRKGEGEGKGKGNGGGQGKDSKGEGGDGKCQHMDSHSWSKKGGKQINQDFLKEMIKSKIRESAQRCKGRGLIPGEIQSMLDKWEHESKLDWKGLLRDFVLDCFASNYEQTFRRESRRHPDMYPGRKKAMIPEFTIGVDTSGSMSDELLGVVMKEIEQIASDFDSELNVWQFDAQNYNVDAKYRRGDYKGFKLVGRGGTDFQPIIDKCVQRRLREVIIFTDGGAPTPEFKGVKVCWIFPESHQDHPGRKVIIPDTKDK